MSRTIIHIDESLCNGCGLCVSACQEGVIGLVNGKAHVLRQSYCDGLGDCLPACPTGAISLEKDEMVACPYEAASSRDASSCYDASFDQDSSFAYGTSRDCKVSSDRDVSSQLSQWPVQIKLAPVSAPYFDHASLLIAADCTAFAYANMHERFIAGHIVLVGCPKLDAVDYSDKLAKIIAANNIARVDVVRMEVPCCGGIERAVQTAIELSGKAIPCQVSVISIKGEIRN
jgi:NAD-dependent dihydropyrimidine dehydrogenase PreA subunit